MSKNYFGLRWGQKKGRLIYFLLLLAPTVAEKTREKSAFGNGTAMIKKNYPY